VFSFGLFSRAAVLLAFCMALTPAIFTVGPFLESKYFPVTREIEILNEEPLTGGTSFYVRFQKVRQCEFAGLAWYDGNLRLPVDFEPNADQAPRTRPPGNQYAGPWFISGLDSTSGSRAFVYHRCHPLWTTITRFFAG
jgi:hypothetical protein